MPYSRFALHSLAPPQFTVCALFLPLIHGLCAFFMPLLTPVSTAPFFASLSAHGLHFTLYVPSSNALWTTVNLRKPLTTFGAVSPLCKFGAVKNFWKSAGEKKISGVRGSDTFRIVFRILFRVFSNHSSYRFKHFSEAISFCRCAALTF